MKKYEKTLIVTLSVIAMVLVIILGCVGCQNSGNPNPPEPSGTISATENGGTGATSPSTEATKPSTEATEPSTEATEPSTEVTEPSTEVTEPSTEVTEPSEPVVPPTTEPTEKPSEPTVHEHNYYEHLVKATCTTDGYIEYTCMCGDKYTAGKIPATGHKWGEWTTVEEPTESETGLAGRNCTLCGKLESKVLDKVIPQHTHKYTGKVTKAATCSAEGVKTYTCSCGSTYTEAIAKVAHNYKGTVKEVTCVENGYTEYKCSVCGDSYKDDYVGSKGHDYKLVSSKEATCSAEGSKTYACHCGESYTKKTSKAAHKYVDTVTKPTCTKEGYTTHKCSVCSHSYTDAKKAATGHSYTSKVTTPATCTKDGVKTYTCSVCSHSYTEAVKGKHNWKHVNEIPADCEEAIDCECGISATYAWAEAYGCDTLEETLYEMHKEWYGDGDLAEEHKHERVVIRVYLVCGHDGWKCTVYEAEQAGFGVGFDAAINYYHNHAKTTGKFTDHSYHTEREYVDVDGYDVCTECGAKK